MPRMLCLEVLENGRVVKEHCVDRELFEEYLARRQDDSVDNWITIIGSIFKNVSQNQSYQPLVYDYQSFSHAINFKAPISGHIFDTSKGALNAYISVGTDSTATTVDTHSLRSPVAEKPVDTVNIDYEGRTVLVTATFLFTTNVTIYEVGLSIDVVDANGSVFRALLDRTVISGGVTVQAGQALRVTYRFSL